MFSILFFILPVWTGLFVSATPVPGKSKGQVNTHVAAVSGNSCTFSDAAQAIQKKGSCSTIILQDVSVPAGQTLNLDNLNDNTHVIFSGRTTFGYKPWDGDLISISGKNLLIEGAPGNVFDCHGERWWDTKGTNGGKPKPKFFNVHNVINSNITGLNVLNTPAHAFGISSSTNVGIFDVTIDDSLGDTKGAHNTDGFDISTSSGIHIERAKVTNQDDCVAINSGSNITVTDCDCRNGHGLSIGSVGYRSSNVVKDVHIVNSRVSDSLIGVRIKTIAGAKGSVSNVVFENIALKDIVKFGIIIQQDYKNTGPTGKPTSGVPITDLTVKNVVGNVKPGGTNVHIACAACSGWNWSDNKVLHGTVTLKNLAVPHGVVL